jgi:membrane-anchored mycosin MYCP
VTARVRLADMNSADGRMSIMRRIGYRTLRRFGAAGAAAALTVGTVGAAPAGAATGSSTCTTQQQNIKPAPDQTAQPWEIAAAGADQIAAGSHPLTGAGVTVAVIDTGVNKNDPQLGAAIENGMDLTGSGAYNVDSDGHGTMVASIIAARHSSRNGMVGIAPQAKLLIYREAGCGVANGNNESSMADAINAAVAAKARVINISQDGYIADTGLRKAVQNAYQNNVVVVTSAGNYGDTEASDGGINYGVNPRMYPAAYAPYLLAVGAADPDGIPASFSEHGSYVGITAPGKAIGALFPDGRIMIDDGTSFAAPYVAAAAALVIQQHPAWPASTVIKVLEATASGNHQWTASTGWGEVNIQAALGADPAHLPQLFGAGPNADGPAAAAPAHRGVAMAPILTESASAVVVNQRKGAYIALGSAGLVVVLAATGTVVARDARRRRLPR